MAYGNRTGVTTVLKLTKHLCSIYNLFSVKITGWVNASSLSDPNKAFVNGWLGNISAVCALLKTVPDD
jgi:hypothetical protein